MEEETSIKNIDKLDKSIAKQEIIQEEIDIDIMIKAFRTVPKVTQHHINECG